MAGVSLAARVELSLVASDVRATLRRSSRSTSLGSLKVSRNYGGELKASDGMTAELTLRASILASSKPSVMIRGCSPSAMYRSACFSSSPTSMTTEVVPSPQISSCAVAARAIMTAVGFCICISRSRTLPSLVNLI